MILGEDFKFRDDLIKETTETVPIELLTGPFKGVILRYTEVSVKEEEDQARLQFQYDILKMPGKFSQPGLKKNKIFTKHIGLILNTLILEAVDKYEHGTGNTEITNTE